MERKEDRKMRLNLIEYFDSTMGRVLNKLKTYISKYPYWIKIFIRKSN